MRYILAIAVLLSLSVSTRSHAHPCPRHDACPGLYKALRASVQRAYYAERWHYLAPDSVRSLDWKRERSLRAAMVAELRSCKRHRAIAWGLR